MKPLHGFVGLRPYRISYRQYGEWPIPIDQGYCGLGGSRRLVHRFLKIPVQRHAKAAQQCGTADHELSPFDGCLHSLSRDCLELLGSSQ